MDDVTSPNEAVNTSETTVIPSAGVEKSTVTSPQGETGEQPGVTGQNPVDPERENLKKALKAERDQRREMQREIAKFKAEGQVAKQSAINPDNTEQLYADPRFQELLIKVAKQELTDYTREILTDEKYVGIPEVVKKAILKNVRGFVNETTTDPETAKVDILDYIEGLLEETAQTPPKTGFPIAATNQGQVQAGTTPDEIAEIASKSMDQITDEEATVLENYLRSQSKKSKK